MKTEFDIWLLETHRIIEKIQEVGKDVIYNTKIFTSPEFSFNMSDVNGGWIFKSGKEIDKIEYPIVQTTLSPPILSSWPAAQIQSMSSNYVSKNPIFYIKVHLDWYFKIKSIKWLKKTERGLGSIVTSTDFDTWLLEDGCHIHSTMLFLDNNRIMIDGEIYSNDNPDAFTTDLVSDSPKIRYLDLLDLREVYQNALF